jgi:F-type H+-transporting ATPase subunit epsilon
MTISLFHFLNSFQLNFHTSILSHHQTYITMNLEILTPERKLFSDEVYGVQLPGVSGSFEVLDKHASLVSALKSGRIKVLNDHNQASYFDIKSGFVEVINNRVTVLVEGAKPV